MSTVRQCVNRAFRLIAATQSGENIPDEDAQNAMEALNGMLNSWYSRGIDLEFTNFTNLDDVIPYADDHYDAFCYNLAVRIAPEFSIQPDPAILAIANENFRMLQAQYADPDTLNVDPEFNLIFNPNMPSTGWRP